MKTFITSWYKKTFTKKKTRIKFQLEEAQIYIWHTIPFVRMVLPLIVGILSEKLFKADPCFLGLTVFFLFVFYTIWLITFKLSASYHWRTLTGIFIVIIFVFFGNLSMHTGRNIYLADHYINLTDTSRKIAVAIVDEPPIEKEKSFRVKASLVQVYDGKNLLNCSGNILLYIEKDDRIKYMKYGNLFSFELKPQKPQGPLNPFEFDYQNYLASNNIYFTQFIKSNTWKNLKISKGKPWFELSYFLKGIIFDIYRKYMPNRKQSGVAAALIFGYREELDPELVTAYAHTGTLHVLAVSGLHVGIIYAVLRILLSFLKRNRKTQIIQAVLIILFLWFYALLTGFSPSVLRAAFMFTFIVLGDTVRRNINIYNSIAASAFLLLLYNPLFLFDVGFQLSYAAVLGIIYLHPKINQLYTPCFWLDQQIWTLLCVSLAAQAATCPLGFYYFHQFPNYFLISNLLIIPLSTIITYLGLLLLVASFIPSAAAVLGQILDRTIYITDWLVIKIDAIPFSTTNDLVINLSQAVGIAFFILSSVFLFSYKNKRWIWVCVGSILFICLSKSNDIIEQKLQQSAWVYQWNGAAVMSFVYGNTCHIVADSFALSHDKLFNMKIKPHLVQQAINKKVVSAFNSEIQMDYIKAHHNLIVFNGLKILVLNQKAIPQLSLPIDYIVLSQSPNIHLLSLSYLHLTKKLIVDGSNKNWLVKRWKKEAQSLGIAVHFTNSEGAVRLE